MHDRSVTIQGSILLTSGVPKPANAEQPILIKIVVGVVRKMILAFNSSDIIYVRSLRNSKAGVLNVECRSIAVATAVKSTFASLVKSNNPPAYLKNVSLYVIYDLKHISLDSLKYFAHDPGPFRLSQAKC